MKRERKIDECYGKNCDELELCRWCRWKASCRVYEFFPQKENRGHMVSYEQIENWCEQVADKSPLPGDTLEEKESEKITPEQILQFFRYILSLDAKTISMLSRIFASYDNEGEACSVQELADDLGLTRQAVHTRILKTISKHPELRNVFAMTLRHIPRRGKTKWK